MSVAVRTIVDELHLHRGERPVPAAYFVHWLARDGARAIAFLVGEARRLADDQRARTGEDHPDLTEWRELEHVALLLPFRGRAWVRGHADDLRTRMLAVAAAIEELGDRLASLPARAA